MSMAFPSRKYPVLLFSSFLVLTLFIPSLSRAEEDEGAYIVANIKGSIPPVKPCTWTPIKIEVQDVCGFNWTYFSEDFLNIPLLRWYGKLLVWVIWPKIFFRSVADYFGYNSLSFYPEIVEGNPKGWKMKVMPSTVSPTTDGYTHNITLYVWADETAMDYAVTIGIKCVRYGSSGKMLGSSYIYIPVKLDKFSYVEMYVKQPRKIVPPWSTSYVTAVITNKGYYEDTFHLSFECEGGIRVVTKQRQFVIKPGESKEVTFVITTPREFFEYGKSYEVKVYATPVLNQSRTYLGSFIVMVEGVSSNPQAGGFYIASIIINIIIIIAIFKRISSLTIRRGLRVEKPKMIQIPEKEVKKRFHKVKKGAERRPKGEKKSRDELTKLKLIEKIRREQEKQRRKLKL